MKVALCIPVHDHTKALFTMSALALQAHTFKARPDIEFQGHLHHKNSRIEEARERLAQAALDGGADWMLWLDADQAFPPDTLVRLLAHDLAFVGCNARKKVIDRKISATRNIVDGKAVPITPKREGVDPVDLLGFGVTLTKASMFTRLPRPWFRAGPFGEDGFFSLNAAAHGFRPYVDHALSAEVGHIAETVLKF